MTVKFESTELGNDILTNNRGAFTRSRAAKNGAKIVNDPANTVNGRTYLELPESFGGALRQAFDTIKHLRDENNNLKLEKPTFNHYVSTHETLERADNDIQDQNQRSIFARATRNVVNRLFGAEQAPQPVPQQVIQPVVEEPVEHIIVPAGRDNNAGLDAENALQIEPFVEVRVNENANEQKQTLIQRFGLNTRAGQLKFVAALAIAGLGTYYLMNNSSECVSILSEKTSQLNQANGQISSLKNDLKVASETVKAATQNAETAKKYTRIRDALLQKTCELFEPKTQPENLAAKAVAFYSGCSESPKFNSATQAMLAR